MHVLLVLPHAPSDPTRYTGGDQRTRMFIEGIARTGAEMSFLYFVPQSFLTTLDEGLWGAEWVWGVRGGSRFAPILNRRETLLSHYLSGILDASQIKPLAPYTGGSLVGALREALNDKPDLIFVSNLTAMLPVIAACPNAPVLFDLDDLVHKVQWRSATTAPFRPGKVGYALQIPAIVRLEHRAISRAAWITFSGEGDRRAISWLGGGSRVACIPNAIVIPPTPAPPAEEPSLLFLGNFKYEPNVVAAERLLSRIWPRIRARRSEARLVIAGIASETLISRTEAIQDSVTVAGFVPDLTQLYARARVVCCPLDIGGGTRVKLLEAAGYARAMVSTRVGAEGLEFRDGTEIVLRDDDKGFAEACLSLLADPHRCIQIGAAARARVLDRYDPNAVRSQISALVRDLVASRTIR